MVKGKFYTYGVVNVVWWIVKMVLDSGSVV